MVTVTFTRSALWRVAVAASALSPAVQAQFTNTTAAPTETATSTSTLPSPTLDPVFNPGVGAYSLVGCYAEPDGARALASVFVSENQTVATCIEQATAAGALYAGLEYGTECWYGGVVHQGARTKPLDECGFLCGGSAGELCGASNRLLLYSEGGVVPPLDTDEPTQPAVVGDYEWHGCMTEATGVRALNETALVSATMTLQTCATFCAAYTYFGVEYSSECYCGNTFNAGSELVPSSECSMVCSGSGIEFCGAGNRLSAYAKTA